MATATHIPLEVYLRSEYEPSAEYVDGEILERPVGELDHANWQDAISTWFRNHAKEWNIRVFPELRVQVIKGELPHTRRYRSGSRSPNGTNYYSCANCRL
jgi:hypothetical protein